MENDRQDLTVNGAAARDGVASDGTAKSWSHGATTIVLIDRRAMYRDCFSQYLSSAMAARVLAFASAAEWLDCGANVRPSLIILVHAQARDTARLFEAIAAMTRRADCAPLFVLSDIEDDESVEAMLRSGVRGHVSTHFAMDVVVKAARLVSEGGVFAPARSFAETRPAQYDASPRDPRIDLGAAAAAPRRRRDLHRAPGRCDRGVAQGRSQQDHRL